VAKHPAVALSRRDWEFLFAQLKSTHAVAQYLDRVAGDDDSELDHEVARYTELALADLKAEPGPINAALLGPSARTQSTPLLPLVAQRDDPGPHAVVRWLLEDVALSPLGTMTESSRIQALAEIDRLYVGYREELGTFLLDSLKSAAKFSDGDTWWQFRSVRADMHLGFGVCSHFSRENQELFHAWVELRHFDFCNALGRTDVLTVGVLLTPRRDGLRDWDTSVASVTGEVTYEPQLLADLRKLWPSPDADELRSAA
jgi:hypothetical protein